MSLKTPVAFLVFNRPETTARVFAAIRKAKPSRLLVVADGPRAGKDGELQRCAEVRALIKPNWPCRVERNFASTNMGCKRRIQSGLNWVFKKTPEAIILEDDCLPAPDFFSFAAAMLSRYRKDERVKMISGSNFAPETWQSRADYGFTRHVFIWGWASWSRAWKNYDANMSEWPIHGEDILRKVFPDSRWARLFWKRGMRLTHNGAMDTWDYQWIWTLWKSGGLNLVPRKNLVSNIGAGEGASHGDHVGKCANLPLDRMPGPWMAPPRVDVDELYFRDMETRVYSGQGNFDAFSRAKFFIKEFLRRG